MTEFGFYVPDAFPKFQALFYVGVTKDEQSCEEWSNPKTDEPHDYCIIKVDGNIYHYGKAQDIIPILDRKYQDIDLIIKTFKFIK
mgnify:FL=1